MNSLLGKHISPDPRRRSDDLRCQDGCAGLIAQALRRNTERRSPSEWGLPSQKAQSAVKMKTRAPQPLMWWPTTSQRKQTGDRPLSKSGCGGFGQNPRWVLTSHWCHCLDRHCGCEENIDVLNRWRSALSDNTKKLSLCPCTSKSWAPSLSRSNRKKDKSQDFLLLKHFLFYKFCKTRSIK